MFICGTTIITYLYYKQEFDKIKKEDSTAQNVSYQKTVYGIKKKL